MIGRMIGFNLVATVILAAMAAVGYVFVVRSLSHVHQLDGTPEEITAAIEKDGQWLGRTTLDKFHRHNVTVTGERDGFWTLRVFQYSTVRHAPGRGGTSRIW